MFTINEIKAAHSKIKSGTQYPAYVGEIIKMESRVAIVY